MCFSLEASAGFAAAAIITASLLYYRGRPSWAYGLFLYFALMETLQGFQYLVMPGGTSTCMDKSLEAAMRGVCTEQSDVTYVNRVLMLLNWLHICFQPVVVNRYIFGVEQAWRGRPSPALATQAHTAQKLALAGGVLLSLKALPAFLELLPAVSWLQQLREAPEALLPWPLQLCKPEYEMLCGPSTYSNHGTMHVAWHVRMLATDYYVPHVGLHFFLFFIPPLLFGSLPTRLLTVAAWLTGPGVTELLIRGSRNAQMHEFAAVWCQFSVAQCFLAWSWEFTVAPLMGHLRKNKME